MRTTPEPRIEEMYEEVREMANSIPEAISIKGWEGSRGITMGGNDEQPQVIRVEFKGDVDSQCRIKFLELVNRKTGGWKFCDETGVFEEDFDKKTGEITISRDVEGVPAFDVDRFEREEKL